MRFFEVEQGAAIERCKRDAASVAGLQYVSTNDVVTSGLLNATRPWETFASQTPWITTAQGMLLMWVSFHYLVNIKALKEGGTDTGGAV